MVRADELGRKAVNSEQGTLCHFNSCSDRADLLGMDCSCPILHLACVLGLSSHKMDGEEVMIARPIPRRRGEEEPEELRDDPG